MTPARWIGLGDTTPERLHGAYCALAQCMAADDPPAVVWGRASAHLCLGQSQDPAAELLPEPGVPVLRRPLGGGLVWVDPDQDCYALVAPLAWWPRRHEDWYARALAPAAATFRRFGLTVALHGRDLWLDGRKIAGSGAATLAGAGVVASSFIRRFPARRFAACVAAPSDEFRDWLAQALPMAMTDWQSHAAPPACEALGEAFRAALAEGWRRPIAESALTPWEEAALRDWLPELEPEPGGARRTVPHGIKLNESLYLFERHAQGRRALLRVRDGIVERALLPALPAAAAALAGCSVEPKALARRLAPLAGEAEAARWADFIAGTARPSPAPRLLRGEGRG